PESTTLASETGVNTNVFPPKTQTLALKSQNEWVFSVQPGYRVKDNHLAYAKLSYHTMDAVASSSLYADTQKESIEAPGFGLGYAIAITPNLQVQGEYESITFSRSGLTKSSQDVLTIGVAYRF
ncbi:MAG: outer membrane beta-barrel protein, partial [Rhodoferax sp.]|nr:outer membrane beta-barrel protein [Rhodoferax sp.]